MAHPVDLPGDLSRLISAGLQLLSTFITASEEVPRRGHDEPDPLGHAPLLVLVGLLAHSRREGVEEVPPLRVERRPQRGALRHDRHLRLEVALHRAVAEIGRSCNQKPINWINWINPDLVSKDRIFLRSGSFCFRGIFFQMYLNVECRIRNFRKFPFSHKPTGRQDS